MFWVFDRRTGELLVEVEERPMPQAGTVEAPGRLSPMLPFVVDFPNALKPDLEERHMWGMTLLDQLYCRILYRRASYQGIYTPPSADRHWIQYPGYNGGSDWGGVAIDTARGIMVANYNDTPNHNRLIPREEADAPGRPAHRPAAGGAPEPRRPRPPKGIRPGRSGSMRDGGCRAPGFCASSRPMAASWRWIWRPAGCCGTNPSARRAGTGRSAFPCCCPSPSVRPTTPGPR